MKRQGIDPAYAQVAHPDAGTRSNPGKDSSNPCDAKGNPGGLKRNATTVATEASDIKVKELRSKQLGSNSNQSNGFDPIYDSYTTPAERRGFDKN